MQKSDSIAALAKALVAATKELKNPGFDKTNPHFKNKYATLAGVRDTVTPVLQKHGLTVQQFLCNEENGVACETVLLHESGEWMSSTFSVPVSKHDAQGVGSAATYARRYALMALCNVVGDDDDDGNAAAAAAPAKVAKPRVSGKGQTTHDMEQMSEEMRTKLQNIAFDVVQHINDGNLAVAYQCLVEQDLDATERSALWALFDSKQRSALKAEGARTRESVAA